jgi:hypothetical protein
MITVFFGFKTEMARTSMVVTIILLGPIGNETDNITNKVRTVTNDPNGL